MEFNASVEITPKWIEKIVIGNQDLTIDMDVLSSLYEKMVIIEAVRAIDVFEAYNKLSGLTVKKSIGSHPVKLIPKKIEYIGPDGSFFCIAFRVKTETC